MFERFNPSDYAIGDPIFIQIPDGWAAYSAERFVVSKKTPSGQIVAERAGVTIRISARGSIVGDGAYSRRSICSPADAKRFLAEKRVRLTWSRLRDAGEAISLAARQKDGSALEAALVSLASAIEARRAATLGAVHESPVGKAETP